MPVLAAFDLDAVRYGLRQDLSELTGEGLFGWTVLVMFFGLPIASLLLLLMRRWLALIPLAISIGLLSLWFLYYATDWWPNPGLGALGPLLLLVLLGWTVVGASAWKALRSRHSR